MTADTWALLAAVFAASFVEMVEATTIVMAMGYTRGWRSALIGVAAALVALAVFTLLAGYALASWLPEAALQLVIGTLLLIFGLQWLRKAILRSSGRQAMHDEESIYAREVAEAQAAGARGTGLDGFALAVSFKGVFLEGVEVVFIVITFGLSADAVPTAAVGAAAAVVVVSCLALIVRKPLAMVPENTMKYGVGLLLAAFGTTWAVEGLGALRAGHASLEWPGGEWAILALLGAWLLLSRGLVRLLAAEPVEAAA